VHVRYLRSSVEKLWTKQRVVGGGALARDGLYLYQRARRMLDEADYNEATGHQLISAAGELAVCVGWLAYRSATACPARLPRGGRPRGRW
jgi:hypothetical protein